MEMEIDKILEEIENLVASSNRVPFLDKVMIDDVELFRLMDVLRSELPRQIQEAGDIVNRRDEIISAAQMEAERLVDGAKREAEQTIERANAYAQKAVDENEIVVRAKEQEKAIMDQTMAAAQQMKDETELLSSEPVLMIMPTRFLTMYWRLWAVPCRLFRRPRASLIISSNIGYVLIRMSQMRHPFLL